LEWLNDIIDFLVMLEEWDWEGIRKRKVGVTRLGREYI